MECGFLRPTLPSSCTCLGIDLVRNGLASHSFSFVSFSKYYSSATLLVGYETIILAMLSSSLCVRYDSW